MIPSLFFRARRRGAWLVIAAMLAVISVSAPAAAANKSLLVFGDSLVAGLGLSQADGFTTQLQQALAADGHKITVVNGGVSGDTTATGLARLDWALSDKPDAVLLELGANDMLQGLPVADARANLEAILAKLRAKHLPVLVAGMQANRGLGPDYVKNFDALYPALAKKYDTLLYPFFLDGVALDQKLNQDDLMHPNAQGVKIIVGKMLPSVEKLLAEIGK